MDTSLLRSRVHVFYVIRSCVVYTRYYVYIGHETRVERLKPLAHIKKFQTNKYQKGKITKRVSRVN